MPSTFKIYLGSKWDGKLDTQLQKKKYLGHTYIFNVEITMGSWYKFANDIIFTHFPLFVRTITEGNLKLVLIFKYKTNKKYVKIISLACLGDNLTPFWDEN